MMKCATHNVEATAVCSYCGKSLCPSCSRSGSDQRNASSDACAAALARADKATEIIIRKSMASAKATAFTCYLCGALFVISGVGAVVVHEGALFMRLFSGTVGIALLFCAFFVSMIATRQGV